MSSHFSKEPSTVSIILNSVGFSWVVNYSFHFGQHGNQPLLPDHFNIKQEKQMDSEQTLVQAIQHVAANLIRRPLTSEESQHLTELFEKVSGTPQERAHQAVLEFTGMTDIQLQRRGIKFR